MSSFGLVPKGMLWRAGVAPGSPGGPKPVEQFCHPLLTHCKSHEDGGTAQVLELVRAGVEATAVGSCYGKCRDVELLRQCYLVALGTHDTRESSQESNHTLVSPRSSQRTPKQGLAIRKGGHCHAPLTYPCHLSSPR